LTPTQITYLIFGIVLVLAIIFDLGLLSKKSTVITIQKALYQTIFWVCLALAFFVFLWFENGHKMAFEYFSSYLMEWSLSIDNIFVFILIFSFFGVKQQYYARVLIIGILLAILFRIIFITVGIVLVNEFHWLLYVFGGVLIITGIRMFFARPGEQEDLEKNRVYRLLKKIFPITSEDSGGHFSIKKDGKKYYTNIFVVVILLATTDIVFAVDSIPAVFGITQNRQVIYTSNIFAVLGLRSLFFLLHGAVNKFAYLQHGIAVVLLFIGLKMLAEMFDVRVSVFVSLAVIVVCITVSIIYSVIKRKNSISSEL